MIATENTSGCVLVGLRSDRLRRNSTVSLVNRCLFTGKKQYTGVRMHPSLEEAGKWATIGQQQDAQQLYSCPPLTCTPLCGKLCLNNRRPLPQTQLTTEHNHRDHSLADATLMGNISSNITLVNAELDPKMAANTEITVKTGFCVYTAKTPLFILT